MLEMRGHKYVTLDVIHLESAGEPTSIVEQGNQKPTNILKTQNKVIPQYEKVKSKEIVLTVERTRYLRKKMERLQILDEVFLEAA